MKLQFRASFARDLKRVKDAALLAEVRKVIKEIEDAESIHGIGNLRKLRAEGRYFRVRIGDYRIGLTIEGDVATLVRVLHRNEIYRYFP